MNKKMIVFDMDGTLVDTRSIVIDALNHLSVSFKFDLLEEEDVRQLRNTRSVHFLKVLGIPLWRGPFVIKKVQKILAQKIGKLELVEGMENVLHELKADGYILGVATSNSKKNADLFFEKFKGKFFDFRRSDIFPFGKHRALKKIGKEQNIDLKDIYYVGDETRDILSAKKAGVSVIAVTWGFNSREILESMEPDFVADSPLEILSFLREN